MPESNILNLLISFCGGILGAAFGALNAFVLCGIAAIIGTILIITTGNYSFNQFITWGPVFGPHVAFAGGVAAAAYAAKIAKLSSGRDVLTALYGLNSPMILFVGGIFGVLGYLLNFVFTLIPDINGIPWTNTIGLSIVINGIIVRLLFGRTGLFRKIQENKNRWFISSEEGWQPWPSPPFQVLLIAVSTSLPIAYLIKLMPSASGIFFGLAACSLLFFQFGAHIPVILHIALSTEFVVLSTGSIGWGLIFGILAAFATELYACIFLIHGDTHIDPPSMALVTVFTLLPILSGTGIFQLSENIVIVLAGIVVVIGVFSMRFLKQKYIGHGSNGFGR